MKFKSYPGINPKIIIITILALFTLSMFPLSGQEDIYKYFYRVYFKDKGENHISDFTPSALFSQRAIERREKNGISGLDFKDIPVSKEYLDIISSMGLKLHCTSKWMNTALFKSTEQIDINIIQSFPFVEKIAFTKTPIPKSAIQHKFSTMLLSDDVNPYLSALLMVNGEKVHNAGFEGSGVLIAVLDGGFIDLDKLPAFDNLRARNGIIGTYDFVERSDLVYDYHKHGSDIMCILAGDYTINVVAGLGKEPTFHGIIGSAMEADYLLLRTENTFEEYPAEEDFWTAGAEYADSAGCDIITSSLGYRTFDDPSLNYKFSDMDGKTAFITQAADVAFSRGIIVVCSAGNERLESWGHINAPSDGENVIGVGAVDWNEIIATFSSPGPSADGRIKPDVVAQGLYLPVQEMENEDGYLIPNVGFACCGTSFSCPIISGMAACLMQAVPEAKAADIISTIREVSDRFNNPDTLYGYGIPDFAKAVTVLQRKFIPEPKGDISIGPNPFKDHLKILFKESPESLILELLDSSGNPLYIKNYLNYISLSFELEGLQNLKPGLFFLRLTTTTYKKTFKLIKANR